MTNVVKWHMYFVLTKQREFNGTASYVCPRILYLPESQSQWKSQSSIRWQHRKPGSWRVEWSEPQSAAQSTADASPSGTSQPRWQTSQNIVNKLQMHILIYIKHLETESSSNLRLNASRREISAGVKPQSRLPRETNSTTPRSSGFSLRWRRNPWRAALICKKYEVVN